MTTHSSDALDALGMGEEELDEQTATRKAAVAAEVSAGGHDEDEEGPQSRVGLSRSEPDAGPPPSRHVSVPPPPARLIGRVVGEEPGPTLIAIAGIHGNERAGVAAADRVLDILQRRVGAVSGEFVALSGNLGAMQQRMRYRLRDMNRVWTAERIEDLEEKRGRDPSLLDEEDVEQLDLLDAIREAIVRARGPVFLIDLHTTSALGFPFILFGDTLKQRRFAGAFPLPVVLGLEEQLDGVLSGYFTRQGVVTCAVEGGQHNDPGSIDNLEAVLLLGAESAGLLGDATLTEVSAAHALLERRRGTLPRVMEVVSRHAITDEDLFVMKPGFQNLARVKKGQLLARDRRGAIRAPKDGVVILPLYQGQGSDGFFWGREVSATRLRLAEVLRQMKVDRLFDLVPGLKRDPETPTKIVVGEATLRKLDRLSAGAPTMVFQLLGYRRVRHDGADVTLERQPEA